MAYAEPRSQGGRASCTGQQLEAPTRDPHGRHRSQATSRVSGWRACARSGSQSRLLKADPRTGGASAKTEAAMCVQGVDVQCVLQFTLIHAAGCALHRRTSRVIHRIELYSVFVSSGPAKAHRDSSRSRASRLVLGKDRGGSLPAVPGGTLASGSSHSLNRFRHHARRTLARLLRVGQVPHCAGLDTSCGWARGAYPRSSKGRRAQQFFGYLVVCVLSCPSIPR